MSVLVVVSSPKETGPLIRWGACFARARGVPVEVAAIGSAKNDELRAAIDAVLDEAVDGKLVIFSGGGS